MKNPAEAGWKVLAPRVGLEPTTTRLTAAGSTIELPRNIGCSQATRLSIQKLPPSASNFLKNNPRPAGPKSAGAAGYPTVKERVEPIFDLVLNMAGGRRSPLHPGRQNARGFGFSTAKRLSKHPLFRASRRRIIRLNMAEGRRTPRFECVRTPPGCAQAGRTIAPRDLCQKTAARDCEL